MNSENNNSESNAQFKNIKDADNFNNDMIYDKIFKNMIFAKGAEAVLTVERNNSNDFIVKKSRIKKAYRFPIIDEQLRIFRTRHEAKILEVLKKTGIEVPELIEADVSGGILKMSFVKGNKLRDVLENNPVIFGEKLGVIVAKTHSAGIIHGDLTTSNIIVSSDNNLTLIDFGLSFFSAKIEERAVDLHLLERALEAKHFRIAKSCFCAFLNKYAETLLEGKTVLERLKIVERRGRYKQKKQY